MKAYSTKNKYSTSSGERVTSSQIETRIRGAKLQKIYSQHNLHGYNFCEDCGKNEINTILDLSHEISVDQCKKTGKAELAWDTDNLKIRCRECHKIHDKLI